MEKKTILCVDDEKVILASLKSQLRTALGENFVIEAADSPQEGLEIVEDYSKDGGIHIVVTDWLMPGMKGDEFLSEVSAKSPGTVNIMLSGQVDHDTITNAFDKSNLYRCLRKPWKRDELLLAVKQGLACA